MTTRDRLASVDLLRGIVMVIMALYLVCLWFSRIRARRQHWWASYL